MTLNATIAKVTDRIEERSETMRATYLDRMPPTKAPAAPT